MTLCISVYYKELQNLLLIKNLRFTITLMFDQACIFGQSSTVSLVFINFFLSSLHVHLLSSRHVHLCVGCSRGESALVGDA
jgi:hypothetical protein